MSVLYDSGSNPTECVTFYSTSLELYSLVPYKGSNFFVSLIGANSMSRAFYNYLVMKHRINELSTQMFCLVIEPFSID